MLLQVSRRCRCGTQLGGVGLPDTPAEGCFAGLQKPVSSSLFALPAAARNIRKYYRFSKSYESQRARSELAFLQNPDLGSIDLCDLNAGDVFHGGIVYFIIQQSASSLRWNRWHSHTIAQPSGTPKSQWKGPKFEQGL